MEQFEYNLHLGEIVLPAEEMGALARVPDVSLGKKEWDRSASYSVFVPNKRDYQVNESTKFSIDDLFNVFGGGIKCKLESSKNLQESPQTLYAFARSRKVDDIRISSDNFEAPLIETYKIAFSPVAKVANGTEAVFNIWGEDCSRTETLFLPIRPFPLELLKGQSTLTALSESISSLLLDKEPHILNAWDLMSKDFTIAPHIRFTIATKIEDMKKKHDLTKILEN